MRRPRARHHTSDANLDAIKRDGAINVSRGWGPAVLGVHVEIEPFGSTKPTTDTYRGPAADLSIPADGAFVEFDLPPDLPVLPYSFSPRNTAIIVADRPLSLKGLNPVYVKVRRHLWEFWRTRPE